MRGLPLSPSEVKAFLHRRVAQLEIVGMDATSARRVLALEYGVQQHRLDAILDERKEG